MEGVTILGDTLTLAHANAAALMFVTAQVRKSARPDPAMIDGLREQTMQTILRPKTKAGKK
jgi:hypothetical protein